MDAMGIDPMPLSDATCRTSKSREKPYKLSDGGGLYLQVEKNGSKLWRHAVRFDGKQKLVALGAYQIEEHLDPQMVIEQEIKGWVFFTLNNDWWFDWARGSSSPKWICYP